MNKKYYNYQWSDFLEDQDFLDWYSNSGSTQSLEFYKQISESPELLAHAEKAKELLQNLQYKTLSTQSSKNKIWSSIQDQIQPRKQQSKKMWNYLAAAAAFVGFIIYFSFFHKELIVEKTQVAEHKLIRLPDSSFVTLNAGSEIQYDKKSYHKNRKVTLKGEAYFQVKKGVPFTVFSDLGEVRVLGTSFNVYSRNDIMNVTCMIGKISVLFLNQEKLYVLSQGMQIKNENHQISQSTINLEDHKFWRDGYFYYNNTPLINVLEELRRQYKINNVEYSNNLLNYKYSGFFKKDNLNEAIESVFLPLKLNASFNNGVLSIKE